MIKNSLILIVFLNLIQSQVWSAEKEQILDFEGEVIEGERKKPEVFLQVSTKELDFGSLVYLRKNFNDYLEMDRRSRTRYFKVKAK